MAYAELQADRNIPMTMEDWANRLDKFIEFNGAELLVGAGKISHEKAILHAETQSDGDYSSLVKFLMKRNKLKTILSPHAKNLCSILLKRTGASIAYMNDQRSILQMSKEKAPDADKTA